MTKKLVRTFGEFILCNLIYLYKHEKHSNILEMHKGQKKLMKLKYQSTIGYMVEKYWNKGENNEEKNMIKMITKKKKLNGKALIKKLDKMLDYSNPFANDARSAIFNLGKL